ncbi:MAG: Phytochrome, two-component sensor histidine kinase [Bacteroidetes bacterium]|nr:Phytochrome, two-component sensor histidine kinase [Bacteroidota bacterium]
MAEVKDISIRKRLIMIQVATAFIAVLICCTIYVFNNIKLFKDTSVSSKNSIAEIVGINAAPTIQFLDNDAAKEMLQKLKSNPSILNATIIDKDGKEFARYDKQGEKEFLFPATGKEMQTQKGLGKTFLVSYRIVDKDFLGTVILRAELTGYTDIILSYVKIALLILLASLVVALIISTLFQRTITDRLLSLVNTTKEVARTGNYSSRAPISGNDEIGVLSVAFNDMLDQIEHTKKDLDETNAELEDRVSKRTEQLELANKELEAFSYSVSHDLRAPVRAINGFAQILMEDYGSKLDAEATRITGTILKNAKKMGQLIDDLLAFSHLGRQDLAKRNVSMKEMVVGICEDLNNEPRRTSTTEFKIGELPLAYCDPVTLRQVWTNLISNAVKYSKLKEKPVVEIGAETKGDEIIYYVKDNGDGFDMKYVNKLFGVFQRLHTDGKFEGTGVGLAIVHRVISKHGGRVWAEGKVGEGATFYFSLNRHLN